MTTGIRCRVVPRGGNQWYCQSAGCGAHGFIDGGVAYDEQNPRLAVPMHELTGPHGEPGDATCLFDRKPKKGSGDFSIGSTVWPGTSKLIEEMGELQQVLGKLIATAGDPDHWSGDLLQKLVDEIGDVRAAIRFFEQNMKPLERTLIDKRCIEKLILFKQWHAEQCPDPRCSKCGRPVLVDEADRLSTGHPAGFYVCEKCLGISPAE